MLGNEVIKNICIIRMNNSKINIVKKLQRVLVCSNEWNSVCNSVRKIMVRKKLRNGRQERWINCCWAPIWDVVCRPKQMHGGIWNHKRNRDVPGHHQHGSRQWLHGHCSWYKVLCCLGHRDHHWGFWPKFSYHQQILSACFHHCSVCWPHVPIHHRECSRQGDLNDVCCLAEMTSAGC